MLKITKNNNRYEIAGIVDPGFLKKGKLKTGLAGLDGCLGSIIGFLLEKIFHQTVSIKINKKSYYFYSSSVLSMVNRVCPQVHLPASAITTKNLPQILAEIKTEIASNLARQANKQRSKLRQAVINGELDKCKELLDKGAVAKTEPKDNQESLLCVAIREHNFPLCQLLVEHGADANERDYTDMTPIEQAVTVCDEKIVKWLIDQGADTTIETTLYKTKAHKAATLLELIERKLSWVDTNPALFAQKKAIIEIIKNN